MSADNPSRSEVWGQFPTLSERLDDLDTHVVDALSGDGTAARAVSALLWTPSLTPDPGDSITLLWFMPDPNRTPTSGLSNNDFWPIESWTFSPQWAADIDDLVLLVVGSDYWPTTYAKVTATGYVPIVINGGTHVSVSCDTYGGATGWIGQNNNNPVTGGTLVTAPSAYFVPQSMPSSTVLLNGGYTGNLSGAWSAADAFGVVDSWTPSGTVEVGSTTTGAPGTDASVSNSGDLTNVVLDFTIPRGEKGEPGDTFSAATGEPMGHPNLTDAALSFDNASRTFTIAPTGATFDVWVKANKFTKAGPEQTTVPNTTGLYFISYDPVGDLVNSTSFFDLENCAPTAAVYWNATTGHGELVFDERHGIVMDWRTHEYLHRTRGSAMASGFGLSGYTIGGSGASNSHAQIALDGGLFYDEDIPIRVVADATPDPWTWQQPLGFPAEIPVLYRSGTEWVLDSPTTFPVKQGTARIRYNQFTGGSWTLTDVANNRYGISWIAATNNLNYPVVAILGQSEYSSLPTADAILWTSLNLTTLPVAEIRPLWRLVFQTATTMSNTPHASLASVSDLRGITSLIIS